MACFSESAPSLKNYRLVLVNLNDAVESEVEAGARAAADFSEACRVDDATNFIEAMGRQLASLGYVRVDDFKIIGKRP